MTLLSEGCSEGPARIKRLQWCTMGTIAAVQSTDLETAQKLRNIAREEFSAVEREFSAWSANSTLSKINSNAGQAGAIEVSSGFTDILAISTRINVESGGAFNPLLGPVLKAWGFNGATPPSSVPKKNDLEKALVLTDPANIISSSVKGTNTLRLAEAGMQLDFGAIAKGYAVDRVWEKARESKLTNALIDLGGNLRVLGEAKPGRGGWLTGIKDPFNKDPFNKTRTIAIILLKDGEAIATSGNYERFVEINGERCAHIIDGRTAMPVKGMASVTVVSPDAATADALSTTLFIIGIEAGKRLIKEHYPDSLALWIPDSQPAKIIATDKMQQRLQKRGTKNGS